VFGVVGPLLWSSRYLQSADGPYVQQKVQEIAQIFPATHLAGNPHQHRRWPAWLPGEKGCDFGGDRPDLNAMPDENDARASRIVFNYKESEGQGFPVPGTSASGAVLGGDEHGIGPIGECF